ncbi:MAG TPA: hypothetical protein VFC23_13955 [Thermoanaerobaculia bacterium]|nr:hypothetical protein [Thermoanaerobaculia bacterium]
MQFIWGVLCQRAIIDERSQKLSAIDIPAGLTLGSMPPALSAGATTSLILDSTYLLEFWFSETDDPFIEVRLFWRAPDGNRKELGKASADMSKQGRNERVRFFLEIATVEYRGFGVYALEVESRTGNNKKWRPVASYPLTVKLKDADPTLPEQLSEPAPGVLLVSS